MLRLPRTRARIGFFAPMVFIAIILLAGIAGLLVNERIEKRERGDPGGGFFSGLAKDL